ncbi:HAD family hydrolase [Nakamurella silvestris]|nr:HAD family hydrolase [Nakamurella silvestris]
MTVLADVHDALLLDLDGTVYLGHVPIEHVADALNEAGRRGSRSIYVTNNASRPPAEVAEQLSKMGLTLTSDDVLTSPQAAAAMLAARHPAGSPVLVIGAQALVDEVARVGLVPVREAAANPVAVVQGHSPETGWPILAEACIALRAGADWVAANVDSTLPTDRGLLPGNGSMVSVLVTATGLKPRVAGKPARPLMDAAVVRAGSVTPLVVGDRLDTDIEAGVSAGVPSLLVFTGVSTPADLLAAPAAQRPNHLALDMRGLVDADRVSTIGEEHPQWTVRTEGVVVTIGWSAGIAVPAELTDADVLAALADLCVECWRSGITALETSGPEAESALTRLGLLK